MFISWCDVFRPNAVNIFHVSTISSLAKFGEVNTELFLWSKDLGAG